MCAVVYNSVFDKGRKLTQLSCYYLAEFLGANTRFPRCPKYLIAEHLVKCTSHGLGLNLSSS